MQPRASNLRRYRLIDRYGVQFVSTVVAIHGIFILATTLLDQLVVRRADHLTSLIVDVPLLVGLTLIYLSRLLRRRKRTAWTVTILAYAFYLGSSIEQIFDLGSHHHFLTAYEAVRQLVLPVVILALLAALQKHFVVRSDTQGFKLAARFSLAILLVAFIYGVAGFILLDKSDFHQEIPLASAVHHTVDQLGLTTSQPLHAYTRRAQIFLGSLSFVSIAAVAYALVSLFQPLRARLTDQGAAREHLAALLTVQRDATSEDFFKLWPHDKQYFFDQTGISGLAFHVYRGVALVVGGPAGKQAHFRQLLIEFQNACYGNDWLPAMVHVEATHRELLEQAGYSLQKLGQEAVLDLAHFQTHVVSNKYFRNITNKFTKQGFTAELLQPPHHAAVIQRLKAISDEWLGRGSRTERGFVMGYFSEVYLQQCEVMVVRDAAGTIQAYLNKVPAAFDKEEATFDMLRHAQASLGNINDFLLLSFIDALHTANYKRLNLGLCPLAGLDEADDDGRRTLIDSVLRFAYANGDRFYSFSGLYKFKNKYEPEWRDRYFAYQGGVRGFSRSMNALMRAMRVKRHAS